MRQGVADGLDGVVLFVGGGEKFGADDEGLFLAGDLALDAIDQFEQLRGLGGVAGLDIGGPGAGEGNHRAIGGAAFDGIEGDIVSAFGLVFQEEGFNEAGGREAPGGALFDDHLPGGDGEIEFAHAGEGIAQEIGQIDILPIQGECLAAIGDEGFFIDCRIVDEVWQEDRPGLGGGLFAGGQGGADGVGIGGFAQVGQGQRTQGREGGIAFGIGGIDIGEEFHRFVPVGDFPMTACQEMADAVAGTALHQVFQHGDGVGGDAQVVELGDQFVDVGGLGIAFCGGLFEAVQCFLAIVGAGVGKAQEQEELGIIGVGFDQILHLLDDVIRGCGKGELGGDACHEGRQFIGRDGDPLLGDGEGLAVLVLGGEDLVFDAQGSGVPGEFGEDGVGAVERFGTVAGAHVDVEKVAAVVHVVGISAQELFEGGNGVADVFAVGGFDLFAGLDVGGQGLDVFGIAVEIAAEIVGRGIKVVGGEGGHASGAQPSVRCFE